MPHVVVGWGDVEATALPAGASPGFEETAPGAEFVAEKAEVSLVFDAKLPPPFRKDLKNLIKNRMEGLAVPVDLHETVIAFPTPRPQPTTPPELSMISGWLEKPSFFNRTSSRSRYG